MIYNDKWLRVRYPEINSRSWECNLFILASYLSANSWSSVVGSLRNMGGQCMIQTFSQRNIWGSPDPTSRLQPWFCFNRSCCGKALTNSGLSIPYTVYCVRKVGQQQRENEKGSRGQGGECVKYLGPLSSGRFLGVFWLGFQIQS